MQQLPRDILHRIIGFGDSGVRSALRLLCRRMHATLVCIPRIVPQTWHLCCSTTRPPSCIGQFEFRMSGSTPVPLMRMVMHTCLPRLRVVRSLTLDLGPWATHETLVQLQHIGSLEILENLSVRVSGNRSLSPPALTTMMQHWVKLRTLTHLCLEAHDCNLGPGSLAGWSSLKFLGVIALCVDFSMNRLVCCDARSLTKLITGNQLHECNLNLELNAIAPYGASILSQAMQSIAVGMLCLWLNPV